MGSRHKCKCSVTDDVLNTYSFWMVGSKINCNSSTKAWSNQDDGPPYVGPPKLQLV